MHQQQSVVQCVKTISFYMRGALGRIKMLIGSNFTVAINTSCHTSS
jgi:hypothetical protein